MEIPGVGRLVLDEDLGAYGSGPVTAGALGGAVGRIFVQADAFAEDDPALHEAVHAFLATDERALRDASPHVLGYCLDTVRLAREQGRDPGGPELRDPESVWQLVTLGEEFRVERGPAGSDEVYVAVGCECVWEPEHGLQIVFRGGRTVSRVGPHDGHLTNASAYGRDDLDGVVYRSPFAR